MSSESTGATGLAGRYATALFELADAQGELDQVAGDLTDLRAMIDESADLRMVLRSPILSRDDQVKALAALLEAAGMGSLTRNFIGVVARNRRLYALQGMISGYRAMLAARRGETTAEVVSAAPLTEPQVTSVKDALKRALGTDVAVDAKVDAGLLGGLIVKVGSRMVDSSLSTKLQQLRLAMKGVG